MHRIPIAKTGEQNHKDEHRIGVETSHAVPSWGSEWMVKQCEIALNILSVSTEEKKTLCGG